MSLKLSEAIAALERGDEVEYRESEYFKWSDWKINLKAQSLYIATKCQYRLKPKPMVIWVNFFDANTGYAFASKERAATEGDILASSYLRTAVKFREVVGEE